MQEHERKDYERLRAEGRWPQATEFREAERKRLRKAGRNRQQACNESWVAMLVKFPPLEPSRPARDPLARPIEANSNELPDVSVVEVADFSAQVRWVQRMLGVDPGVIPARQIPSVGHLQMLKFANDHPKWLYEQIIALDEKAKSAQQAEKTFEDDNRKVFKIFDNIIADLERRKQRADARV